MKKLFFLFFILAACAPPVKDLSVSSAKEIEEADLAMNALAVKEGFNKALLTYADDELVKPQDDMMPIVGKKGLEDHYAGKDGTKGISWAPFKTVASTAGDMGYSLGNWKFETPDTTMFGFYYTIWKRQTDGAWKWVVDGGNNMPGEFTMK